MEKKNVALNDEQQQVLKDLLEWLQIANTDPHDPKVHPGQRILAGGAGTGKTTLIRAFIKASKMRSNQDYAMIAPTAKAAQVLMLKDVQDAATVHSYIKKPVTRRTCQRECRNTACYLHKSKSLLFVIRPESEFKEVQCIIVDEASMLSRPDYELLRRLRRPTLYVGDQFQLPPIGDRKDDRFSVLEKPDYQLRQVMRQEGGRFNPIVAYAYDALREKTLRNPNPSSQELQVISKLDDDVLRKICQVICHSNNTRMSLNFFIRRARGHTSRLPVTGERLLCKKNTNLSLVDPNNKDRVIRLINGLAGNVLSDLSVYDHKGDLDRYATLKFQPDGWRGYFEIPNWDTRFLLTEDRSDSSDSGDLLFTYGYAITCHAAQGSEFDDVAVVIDAPHTDDYRRWLYTAFTRAKKRLFIIREEVYLDYLRANFERLPESIRSRFKHRV